MHREVTRIANPIYDGAFKYLLDDNRVAKFFLSILIGEEVVELELRPTEHSTAIEQRSLTVFRIDFAARIRSADGAEKLVLIEIQKAKFAADIMRFRKYLGQQYASENNVAGGRVREEPGSPPAAPLPILSIYLLGHRLEHIEEPVIRVQREYRDMRGRVIEGPREPFIESLTHDSIVVQIPRLRPSRQTDLEKLLGLFDQSQVDAEDAHVLSIVDEDYPEKFQPVIRRLMKAISDPKVRSTMEVEDEVLGELERLERVVAEKDSALAEKDNALAEKDRVIEENRKALAEKDHALAQKEERLKRAVAALVEAGIPEEEARRRVLG